MDEFDEIWVNHEEKLKHNICKMVTPEDTLVLTGDHTWGGHLSTCRPDLQWIIDELPGRKILLRGNHDIFWNKKKTKKLNDEFAGELLFLQNNFYTYEDYALVGTKGYCYEPWDNNENALKMAPKRYEREKRRLMASLDAAKQAGFSKLIMFLHYPPTEYESSGAEDGGCNESCFTRLAEEYGVSQVIYSHLHGKSHFQDSLLGYHNGIKYSLVSADYLKFIPERIL